MSERIFLFVLDSFGIGLAPDAALFGDEGSNTLKSIYEYGFKSDNLRKLGLFNIDGINFGKKEEEPIGSFARLNEISKGKDTTSGHWEMVGYIGEKPFDVFPQGFPSDFIRDFEEKIGVGTLCNKPYSGTKVIEDYFDEHIRTKKLIVYTSADSVFQIAAHEDIYPRERLYDFCLIARKLLDEKYNVGRVIARPFVGEKGKLLRTDGRHDFSMKPPHTVLDDLSSDGFDVIGVGKINDIFAGAGITENLGVNKNNADGMRKSTELLSRNFRGLAFINLVDGDSVYGHRRDVSGYADCISEFDSMIGEFMSGMKAEDLLLITADHGCDPTFKGTDHTREGVPFLAYKKGMKSVNFHTANGLGFVGRYVMDNLRKKE